MNFLYVTTGVGICPYDVVAEGRSRCTRRSTAPFLLCDAQILGGVSA